MYRYNFYTFASLGNFLDIELIDVSINIVLLVFYSAILPSRKVEPSRNESACFKAPSSIR